MIYKPTVKELEIFCGYTPEEFSEPYEVLEHASRLAKVDAGFVGMGLDEYELKNENENLCIKVDDQFECMELAIYDESGQFLNYVRGIYEHGGRYRWHDLKAFMFRLVLLWMKQQGENNVHTNG